MEQPMSSTQQIINDDCREAMKKLPSCSIGSIITDAPYELNFMSKKWENCKNGFLGNSLYRLYKRGYISGLEVCRRMGSSDNICQKLGDVKFHFWRKFLVIISSLCIIIISSLCIIIISSIYIVNLVLALLSYLASIYMYIGLERNEAENSCEKNKLRKLEDFNRHQWRQ